MNRLCLLLIVFIAFSCGSTKLLEIGTNPSAVAGIYEGEFSCPDCEKIRTRIAIHEDGYFISEQTFYENDDQQSSYYKLGAWTPEKNRLLLTSNEHFYKYLGFLENGQLVLLDDLGKIPENLNESLLLPTKVPEIYSRTFPVEGFLYFEDGQAYLDECNTRKTFALDMGKESPEFIKEKHSEMTSSSENNKVFSSLIVHIDSEHPQLTIENVMTIDSDGNCDQ